MAVSQTLSITEVSGSVNTSANTSQVRILWKSTQTGDSRNGYTRTAKYYVSINGGVETEYSLSYTLPQSSTVTLLDTTITITHKGDGSGSVRVRTWMNTEISAGVVEKAQSLTLTTIPRASTISAVSNRYLGEYCAVKWTPLSKSFRYKLHFSMGNWADTTNAIHPDQITAYLYTGFLIPLDAARQIPNSLTGTMTVTLYTYSDVNATVQIGSASSMTFTVTVPDNEKTRPNATVALSPVHSLESDFAGVFIQGISKVKASISPDGKFGANVVWISMAVEGNSYESSSGYTSNTLLGYGNISVKVSIRDSRGIVNSQTQTISVIPYSKPRVVPVASEANVACGRCDANGNWSDSGTYLKIKARRSYSLCMVNGVQKNFCGLRYRYKKVSDSNYGDWITLLSIDNTATEEVITNSLLNGALSTTESYNVQVDAVDSIPNHTPITFTIPTEKIYLHKAGSIRSLGIGTYVDSENTILIADDIAVKTGNLINGVFTGSKVVSGVNVFDIQSKFSDFANASGNERQTFFIFGAANASLVYGVARVSNNGSTQWQGTTGVTLSTTKGGGVLTVTLPTTAYDIFTVISSRKFTL